MNLPKISLKYSPGNFERIKVSSSIQVANYIRQLFDPDTIELVESVFVLMFNRNMETIAYYPHSTGSTTGSLVDRKLILIAALKCGAQGIIFVHNYPSGNIKPSGNDIQISEQLETACKAIDLQLIDSIIITKNSYYSLKDNNLI